MSKEYISRDKTIEKIQMEVVVGAPGYNTGIKSSIEVVRSIPAADVVEVVRCKDCKYGADYYDGVGCRMPAFPELTIHEKDYFCGYGKHKDDESDD